MSCWLYGIGEASICVTTIIVQKRFKTITGQVVGSGEGVQRARFSSCVQMTPSGMHDCDYINRSWNFLMQGANSSM